MTAFDLIDEYLTAVNAITAADIGHLEGMGCRREIVSGLLANDDGTPPVGKVRAQTFRDGSWQPYDGDVPHYVAPVIDGDLIDLIAWLPSTPSKMFSRTGIASVINPGVIMSAHLAGEPMYLHSDPLSWLAPIAPESCRFGSTPALPWRWAMSRCSATARNWPAGSLRPAASDNRKSHTLRSWKLRDGSYAVERKRK